MTQSSSEPRAGTQVAGTAAFSKFMHLLQIVADTAKPLTVPDLSKLSGYPRATVYRTVAALVAEGLLEMGQVSGRLALGPRLIHLANRSWGRSELRVIASPELGRLRDITGETVHLAVLSGQQMVYIDKIESASAVQMSSRIGTAVPLHSTSVGKAYLAALGSTEQAGLLADLPDAFTRFTPTTLGSKAELCAQLVEIHQRGWSIDDEEREPGICCFGAAITGRDGQPIAAVSVSTLRFRQQADVQRAYVEPLVSACRAISRLIVETPASLNTFAI